MGFSFRLCWRNNFKPTYVNSKDKIKVIKELIKRDLAIKNMSKKLMIIDCANEFIERKLQKPTETEIAAVQWDSCCSRRTGRSDNPGQQFHLPPEREGWPLPSTRPASASSTARPKVSLLSFSFPPQIICHCEPVRTLVWQSRGWQGCHVGQGHFAMTNKYKSPPSFTGQRA